MPTRTFSLRRLASIGRRRPSRPPTTLRRSWYLLGQHDLYPHPEEAHEEGPGRSPTATEPEHQQDTPLLADHLASGPTPTPTTPVSPDRLLDPHLSRSASLQSDRAGLYVVAEDHGHPASQPPSPATPTVKASKRQSLVVSLGRSLTRHVLPTARRGLSTTTTTHSFPSRRKQGNSYIPLSIATSPDAVSDPPAHLANSSPAEEQHMASPSPPSLQRRATRRLSRLLSTRQRPTRPLSPATRAARRVTRTWLASPIEEDNEEGGGGVKGSAASRWLHGGGAAGSQQHHPPRAKVAWTCCQCRLPANRVGRQQGRLDGGGEDWDAIGAGLVGGGVVVDTPLCGRCRSHFRCGECW